MAHEIDEQEAERQTHGLPLIHFNVKESITMKDAIQKHVCWIFDMVNTGEGKYQCHICGKTQNQKDFNGLKSSAPVKRCCCGGIEKRMKLHIPAHISGWKTRPAFYSCSSCGNKYMYYRSTCTTCSDYCDISETYCQNCRKGE